MAKNNAKTYKKEMMQSAHPINSGERKYYA